MRLRACFRSAGSLLFIMMNLGIASSATRAWAALIPDGSGGVVELFDGSIRDFVTWNEDLSPSGSSVSQDDKLFIDNYGGSGSTWKLYSNEPLIGVRDVFRVDVSFYSGIGQVVFGSTRAIGFTPWAGIYHSPSLGLTFSHGNDYSKQLPGLWGQDVTLEIDRVSGNESIFTVYDPLGSVIASAQHGYGGPDMSPHHIYIFASD